MDNTDGKGNGVGQLEFDSKGYLLDHTSWTHELGERLAAECGVEMTDKHWQLVNYARQLYAETKKTPTRRRMAADLGVDPQELFELFPASPMRKLCLIAGLPKPKNCL